MSVDVSLSEASLAAAPALRTEGRLRIRAERIAGSTSAIDIEESGPLRARFPRVTASDALEVLLINTGGGIVGGDRLDYAIEAEERASLSVTSQAAEKIYRSAGPAARISVRLAAARGARLHWLPQETILYDRARVARTIEADVAEDATLTLCEAIVFGRTAMGESVSAGSFRDRWSIRRAGGLVLADALTLEGAIGEILRRPAVAGDACAAATIVQVAPDAESRLDAVRHALSAYSAEAGASAYDGLLFARLLAQDGLALREATLGALAALNVAAPHAYLL